MAARGRSHPRDLSSVMATAVLNNHDVGKSGAERLQSCQHVGVSLLHNDHRATSICRTFEASMDIGDRASA